MAFHDDIKSKHLSNFVLVTIGDTDINSFLGTCVFGQTGNEQSLETSFEACQNIYQGAWTPYTTTSISHRLSTQKITFGGHYYKPILLNIPSISESLDIEQRKYKISSVSLSISDYEVDGERFSDSLNTLMNKEVVIYYASQSCVNLDDCYKAGTYIVRSFSQDEDKVTLNCEDLSQDKLHKDFPLSDLGENEGIPDKYKNKPIPMVFGQVDRSPMVFSSNFLTLIPSDNITDSFVSEQVFPFNYTNSPIFFNSDDGYVNFIEGGENDSNEEFTDYEKQFRIKDNIVVLNYNNRNIFPDGQSSLNKNNGYCLDSTKSFNLSIGNSFNEDTKDLNTLDIASEDSITGLTDNNYSNNPIVWSINSASYSILPFISATTEFVYGQVKIHFNPSYDIVEDETVNDSLALKSFAINGVDLIDYTPDNNKWKSFVQEDIYNDLDFINPNEEYIPDNIIGFDYLVDNQGSYFIEDTIINDIISLSSSANMDANKIYIDMTESYVENFATGLEELNVLVFSNFNNTLDIQFRKIKTHVTQSQGSSGIIDYYLDILGEFNELDLIKISRPTNILNKDFYAHVIGRQGATPNSQAIYTEILSELDFDEGLINTVSDDIELGKYAFTVDKKINSKKLIEELSQSTPLYPYFKDGEFRVKSIKRTYADTNNIIKVEDVINYKYDRTKIEKVYTRVNVKYHYDYGLKDFTKETGDVTPAISGVIGDYSADYYGQNFDQEFVFESKYIRDSATAQNLAKYLCGLHANQHNLITLTLPLNYLTLELGDIVKFDKLIQNRKIFGEDYTSPNYGRNGQNIYGLFFVEKIKKSLDKVEVSLYQLHQFDFVLDGIGEPDVTDPAVYGCTDSTAQNYDPDATHNDGTCEYLVVEGCTNPQAVNYNPDAEADSGTCVLQTDMLPPNITSPVDGFQITNEIEEEVIEGDLIVSDNLISNPENNSFFDNNAVAVSESELLECGLNSWDYVYDLDGNLISTSGYQISVPPYTEQLLDVGTLINIYNDSEELILANVPILSIGDGYIWIEYNQNVLEGYYNVFGYIGISSQDTTDFVQNSDWQVVSFGTDNPILSAGSGTLKIGYTEILNQYAYVDLVDTINANTEINVSIDIKKNVYSDASSHRILIGFPVSDNFVFSDINGQLVYINDETQDYYLTEEWQTIQFSFTLNYNTNRLSIMGRSVNNLTEIEIDNVIITTLVGSEEQIITNEIAPTLNINWDESPSIGQLISALDLTTSGYYKVFISQFIDGLEPTQINAIVVRPVHIQGFGVTTNISEVYPVEDIIGGTLNYTELNFSVNILSALYYRGFLLLHVPEIDSVINAPQNSPVIITFNDGGESSELIEYESEQLTSLSHNVNFGDNDIPVNTDLKLTVTAYSNSQYNETNIFNSTNGIPQASDSINIEWVDEDIEDDVIEE